MIIRATQKKMMSGAVTRVLVGIEEVEARPRHLAGVGPAQRGKGPDPRGGPGVEDVVLLHPVLRVRGAVDRDMDLRGVRQVGLGEAVPVDPLPVPDGDPVAPPELAADAPVLDVVQPVQVHLGPPLRMEPDQPVADRRLGLLDPRIAQPPLPREARLDRHVRALGVADVVLVGLLADERPGGPEELHRLLARGKALHPGELGPGKLVQGRVGVQDVDDREPVAHADLVVRPCRGRA